VKGKDENDYQNNIKEEFKMKSKIFRILTIIRPLVIVKAVKKIVTKNLKFIKEEIICRGPISLCNEVYDQIDQSFWESLEQSVVTSFRR
jgi:hypothetical protein